MRDLRRSAYRCACLLALVVLSIAGMPAGALAAETQTITFDPIPSPAKVGESHMVTATASSGLPVSLTVDAASTAKCVLSGSESGSTVKYETVGTCIVDANQPGGEIGGKNYEEAKQVQHEVQVKESQTINLEPIPSPAKVGDGHTVNATATSGLPVSLSVDPASTAACTLSGSSSGATVTYETGGTCLVDVNQPGNGTFEPASQVQEAVVVEKLSQTISIGALPASAVVGGAQTVTASATSGLPVTLMIDPVSASVCTVSGASVTFIGVGLCTIDADQPGSPKYLPAPRVQQSITVTPAVTLTPAPKSTPFPPSASPPATTAKSSFKAISATLHSPSFTITLKEQVSNAGTLSWVLTFPNGRFGVFGAVVKAHKGKCKAGFMRLSGKCRPKRVTYGRGSMSFAAAGTVTITVKPSAAAKHALKTALRKKKNMRITAVLTFSPRSGGTAVTHTQILTVKLSSAK